MDKTIYTDRNGHALQGNDPVAYFTVGAPTAGDPNISREWNGATWLFSSAASRDLFDADPSRYAPAFGGHCAVGRAMGINVKGSAKRWRIEDGQLYVNKNLIAASQFGLLARRIRKLASESGDIRTVSSTRNPGAAE